MTWVWSPGGGVKTSFAVVLAAGMLSVTEGPDQPGRLEGF